MSRLNFNLFIMKENEDVANSEVKEDKSSKDSVLKLVRKTKTELKAYRKPFEADWKIYDNAYYGKQHKTGEDKKTVKNHIFKIIEGEVPILTDSMPGTQVTASREEKQEDADILNKAISYVYQDQNLPLLLPTLVRSSLMSAPGYLYVYNDPDANNGDGSITYKQLPWKSVLLDGNVQDIQRSSRAVIEVPMRKDELACTWPEHEDEILDMEGSGKEASGGSDNNFENRDVSGGKDANSGKPKDYSADDIVNYQETWIKSFDLEAIPEEETQEELEKEYEQIANGEAPDIGKWENHNAHEMSHAQQKAEILAQLGLPPNASYKEAEMAIEQAIASAPQAQEQLLNLLLVLKILDNHLEEHEEYKKLNPKGKRPKYKDGWRVIKTCGDIVLYDGGNPEQNGFIPIVPFYCYKDDTIYGFGEIKNILDMQQTLNDVDHREFENLKVSSNTGWISDKEADLKDKLTNAPGLHIEKKKGTEVRRLEGVVVSPQLNNRKVSDRIDMGEISGLNEATQGDMPSAGASGAAIQKLQTQAIGRIRLKDRVLQHFSMRRLALITASLIINHWSTEKRLRLRSDNTNIQEFIFDPMKMQDLEYTIDISPGSMAGIDKDALNAFFKGLLDGQHIPFEDFLLVADFPKKEVLLKKLQERNAQAQELEAVQAQMQELQRQNIVIKGKMSPELLSSEEGQVFEEMARQELLAQATQIQPQMGNMAAGNGQANNQGLAIG